MSLSKKSILIKENDLLKLKEGMSSGHDIVTSDEYEVGSEGGANDYFHVNESYNNNYFDKDLIDYIYFSCHENPSEEGYDEGDYADFTPYYEVEAHSRDGEELFYDDVEEGDLEETFGKTIADIIRNKDARELHPNYYMAEDLIYLSNADTKIDINNVDEVNAMAKKISNQNGESPYILTDGSVISFFDHKYISEIEGMTIAKFLDLGNIRVGHSTVEMIKKPTDAQIRTLMRYISRQDELYVEFSKVNGNDFYPKSIHYLTYKHPNAEMVIDEIISYFDDTLSENIEYEVAPSDVRLDSFKKMDELMPKIWDGDKLSSRVRLKLLDIADDFWDFLGTEWVKRKGILLLGSSCNYNWSKYSDIDVHIVVDFSEVDDRTDFVEEYYNSKKNEWNSTHDKLRIYGHTVELYVEDVNADTESSGVYDIEKNEWIKKPQKSDFSDIMLNKYDIKRIAAKIMTKVDDIDEDMSQTKDKAVIRKLSKNLKSLISKVRSLRKEGLERSGEDDMFNIIYKVLRRSGYIDKMYNLIDSAYDKENSIDESNWIKIDSFLNEEVVADGSADTNPYKDRWKKERETLKSYLCNNGTTMTSRENGKQYKVIYDTTLSKSLGINYCICIQWNPMTMEPGNIIYVRAYDKFTNRIFRPQFDTRGLDNVEGTSDDYFG